MSALLLAIPNGSSPTISISRPVLLVGRHVECDVRIDSLQVSRRHCCLAQAENRLIVRDLGSRHGVRVNGRLVEEAILRHGDEMAIAHLIYRVELIAAPIKPPPTPPPKQTPGPILDLEDDFIPLSD